MSAQPPRSGGPSAPIAERLEALRAGMQRHELAAYVVPTADPHQSEYVPATWRRRAWISGFTGSAGTAVVTRDDARLWTDSRYWLQATQELPADHYTLMRQGQRETPGVDAWLADTLSRGDRVGADPECLSIDQWRSFGRTLTRKGVELIGVEENLVDAIWSDRPPIPASPAMALGIEFAGRSHQDKLVELRDAMAKADCEAHVVCALDATAWLFNLRGRDVDCNPLLVSYTIVFHDRAWLFVDATKLGAPLRTALGSEVELRPYEGFPEALESLAARRASVWIDTASTSQAVLERLARGPDGGARIYEDESPISLAKAVKNEVEIAGMRACHVRDGAAVCRFLRWLEDHLAAGATPSEVECAERLYRFRAEGLHFQGISFGTISAYGANGAIVHYSPSSATCAKLEPVGLYLLDSGAQYLDGTTDITRTVACGPVSDEQREAFTLVLKGHIALATARFPAGATGSQLDSFARRPLWEAGFDYGHGTGHGVGHFLCVHEGPIGFSARSTRVPLKPRMVLSNEPGYYRASAFGIRLENLVEIVEAGEGEDGTPFYALASLTLCPIDTACIAPALLTAQERSWLNDYHHRVRERVSPLLKDPGDLRWLETATLPI